MSSNLKQDINFFFQVFENRTEDLLARLPKPVRDELAEEIDLLRSSVQNRLDEEARH